MSVQAAPLSSVEKLESKQYVIFLPAENPVRCAVFADSSGLVGYMPLPDGLKRSPSSLKKFTAAKSPRGGKKMDYYGYIAFEAL